MLKQKFLIIASMAALLSLGGCNKSDYLYVQQPVPPPPVWKAESGKVTVPMSVVTKPPAVDIVWQIGGMTELEKKLVDGVQTFMDGFTLAATKIDWRMAAMSNCGLSGDYLDGEKALFGFDAPFFNHLDDPNDMVKSIKHIIETYDCEKTMTPVMQTLDAHSDFIRNDAHLFLIVSNDSHDDSVEDKKDGDRVVVPGIKSPQFLDYLRQLKGSLDNVTIYGVMGSIDLGCPYTSNSGPGGGNYGPGYGASSGNSIDEPWNYAGSTFEDIIKATNGKVFSLCTQDFGSSLISIAKDITQKVTQAAQNPRFYLSTRPQLDTLEVKMKGEKIPGGAESDGGKWYYDSVTNALIFYDPSTVPPTEEIQVTYLNQGGF